MHADTLFVNGAVWTGDPANPRTHAVAVADGRVVALGDDALAAASSETTAIDLAGGLLLPGFGDGHCHPLFGGLEREGPQIRGLDDVTEIVQAVKSFADSRPDLEWIVGASYDPTIVPGGRFDAAWLDDAVKDRPVLLRAADYHTVWCNTEALRRAGVDASTPDSSLGWIDRRPDGSPLGTLREWHACDLVFNAAPPRKPEELRRALISACRTMAGAGVTWMQDAWVDGDLFQVYLDVSAAGDLTVRANLALRADPECWRDQLETFAAVRRIAEASPHRDMVTVRTVKFFADGVIEGGTAALLDPYLDAPSSCGMAVWEATELAEACAAFDRLNFQCHIHAIGDAGVRNALNAVQYTTATNGPRDRRAVIAHTQLVHPEDLARFAELGVVANFEPLWAQRDALMDQLTAPRIGEQRTAWQYPTNSLLASGAVLSMGSDWPVSSERPLDGLRVAVTRTTIDGHPAGGWIPTECLAVEDAVRAYTAGTAYQAFEEGQWGRIAPTMRADFVHLDTDVVSAPERFGEATVLATWLGGRKTYAHHSG